MKISIEQVDSKEKEEVLVRYHDFTNEVANVLAKLKEDEKIVLVGFIDNQIYRIDINDVYYIEVNENKTFIYGKNDVFESKLKLYEYEDLLKNTRFFRASKKMILNEEKIKCVSPSYSGRFEARLINDESVIISRQYVPFLKKILEI